MFDYLYDGVYGDKSCEIIEIESCRQLKVEHKTRVQGGNNELGSNRGYANIIERLLPSQQKRTPRFQLVKKKLYNFLTLFQKRWTSLRSSPSSLF